MGTAGNGVLEGIRVVDCGAWVAGPSAAMILSDWGADVVKIEPLGGDPYRRIFEVAAGVKVDVCPPFEMDNRGKRSIALDLSTAEGAEIVKRLVATSDVFVTNYRIPALERAGLGYETLAAEDPRLIYARITGYGEDGEDRDRAAYDIGAFWSRAGVAASLTPEGAEPPFQRGGMGDHVTGLALASGVSAALYAREKSGRGQLVSTSLLRAGVYFLGFDLNTLLRLGFAFPPQTRRSFGNPLASSFKAGDGRWFWLLGLEADRHWPKLARALGHEEWLADERFVDVATRAGNVDALYDLLDEILATKPLTEWGERFDAEDLWWSPVQSAEEVVSDPQVFAAGAFHDTPLPDGGAALMVSSPVDYSEQPWGVRAHVPSIGEHGDEVLAELGYDAAAIARLRARKIVG